MLRLDRVVEARFALMRLVLLGLALRRDLAVVLRPVVLRPERALAARRRVRAVGLRFDLALVLRLRLEVLLELRLVVAMSGLASLRREVGRGWQGNGYLLRAKRGCCDTEPVQTMSVS